MALEHVVVGSAAMDKHFLTQNSLSGAVFFVFGVGSWLAVFPSDSLEFFSQFLNLPNGSILISGVFAAVSSPMVGIIIQGLVLFLFYLHGHPYQDMSRRIVAEQFRARIDCAETIDVDVKKVIKKLPDDSLFVLVYYQNAPEYLIEWARRRRDSQHLGENWAMAAVVGIVSSFVLQYVSQMPEPCRHYSIVGLSALFVLVWVAGMLFLRRQMKHDADGLELLWVLGRTHIELFELSATGSPTTAKEYR